MARIDGILFGYRIFRVNKESEDILINALVFLGISSKIKSDASCEVRLNDAKRLREHLKGKIDFSESEVLGIPGLMLKNRKRYATFLGIVISVFCLFYSSGAVWDVRFSECEGIDTLKITEELNTLGLKEGKRWSKLDLGEIETRLLSSSDEVSWVGINRRGTVAYVTLRNKVDKIDRDNISYCNIVASCDGIVEEISVKRGVASVKKGDLVKRGDLLISGVIPNELGGGLTKAEGTVIVRASKEFYEFVPKINEYKVYTNDKTSSISYEILDFSIKILKNSRNLQPSCDIIEYKKIFYLFGRYKLPIARRVTVEHSYVTNTYELPPDEIALACGERLRMKVANELAGAEILGIRTYGSFLDEGYEMRARVSYLCDASEVKPIG